jgi:hypothetical protein
MSTPKPNRRKRVSELVVILAQSDIQINVFRYYEFIDGNFAVPRMPFVYRYNPTKASLERVLDVLRRTHVNN